MLTTRNNLSGSLLNDFDRFVNHALRPTVQTDRRVRSEENEDGWTVRLELPGFHRDQLEVEVKEEILSVKATPADDDKYLTEFQRSFRIPEGIDEAGLSAKHENGVLTLTLPKAPVTEPEVRRIEIS